jgi:hypothetical protein
VRTSNFTPNNNLEWKGTFPRKRGEGRVKRKISFSSSDKDSVCYYKYLEEGFI